MPFGVILAPSSKTTFKEYKAQYSHNYTHTTSTRSHTQLLSYCAQYSHNHRTTHTTLVQHCNHTQLLPYCSQYSHNHRNTLTAPVKHRNHTQLLPYYPTHTTPKIQHRHKPINIVGIYGDEFNIET
jgi:hypothetical protein